MKLDASIEYSIQRSTTKDLKPLKPKHIQNITMASAQRDVQMSDLFKCLGGRMKESSSIVALKSLLLLHIMIREGSHERVLGYLASNPGLIDVYHLKDKHDQLKNVREYSTLLEERISAYKNVKEDFVKGKTAMINYYKQEPLDEQKLKSIQHLQKLLDAGVRCDCFVEDWQSDNPIQIQAFRLIVGDMIGLFHLLNEAVLRLLAGFFELEKPLAKLGLEIYKRFVDLSKRATVFFEQAGRVSMEIGVRIPTFKQAPASLVNTLSDHIKAPNFEEQRVIAREQRAMKAVQGKKTKKGSKSKDNLSKSGSNLSLNSQTDLSQTAAAPATEKASQENDLRKKIALKADPVLIDFFASIDDEVQAFESDTNQGQYADIGGLWYPQQFGQDTSPHASTFGLAENAKTQNQLQKQLEQTEQMFASAGFSLQPAGYGAPAPLSNQSSFNGIPSNTFSEARKAAPNQFNVSNTYSAPNTSYGPSAQPLQQAQPFAYGNNYSQSYGSSQMPAGQSYISGVQPQSLPNESIGFQNQAFGGASQVQSFGAPLQPSLASTNSYVNPFATNDVLQKAPTSNATPFNPFATASNPPGQATNFHAVGSNLSNASPFSIDTRPQPSPYAIPRANTTQPVVKPSQPPDILSDLASLDLSFSSKPALNPKPADPFSGNNASGPFGGQSMRIPSHQQQAFAPVSSSNADPFGVAPSISSNAGPFGGIQSTNDPFNPFSGIQQTRNPQAPSGNMNASNPFGNLDFGGNSRTASNTNGNYIVSGSSNAQPQSLFDPRSAPGAVSDPFSRPSQSQQMNQDLFSRDPFAMPIKNNPNNSFGFQQK